jgi:Na+/H+ antiporter
MSHITLILLLLVATTLLAVLAQRLKLAYPIVLVLGGLVLGLVPGLPRIELDPELVFELFLPPLLFAAAFFMPWPEFKANLRPILLLAVGLVGATAAAVAYVTSAIFGLPLAVGFALGAIVSPPDAVSARAVLQGLKLPRRLSALVEGESLLNDATGLVLFRFAVAATLSGAFSAGAAVSSFFLLALGGILVGLAVAMGWLFVVKRLKDQTLIIMANTLMCWVAYIAGEAVHVSGVLATVVAGLMLGWYQHIVFPAQVRLRGSAFWQTLVFVLEALVFILIGSSLRGVLDRVGGIEAVTATMTIPILGVVLTIVAARFVWIFGSDGLLAALRAMGLKRARPLGMRQATVLSWAGMRGVVTLAVALTLPAAMPGRDLMLVTAFAVIFATVVIQGTSLSWMIRLVGPEDKDPPAKMNMAETEAAIARARNGAVEANAYDEDGKLIHPQLLEQSHKRVEIIERYAADTDRFMEGARTHFDVVLIALAAGRTELIRIHRAGLIEDEVLQELERDLDVEELGIVLQMNG